MKIFIQVHSESIPQETWDKIGAMNETAIRKLDKTEDNIVGFNVSGQSEQIIKMLELL
jgi:mRNA-degrading endonuclease HigB of HigAB toxin-antitoxin module